MPDRDIIDIFDECTDRMAGGETIEACLADYPQHADKLRDLLSTGLLIYQMQQAENSDTTGAEQRTRGRLLTAIQETPTREPKMKRKNNGRPWRLIGLAAAFALIVGIGIGALGVNMMVLSPASSAFDPTGTAIVMSNATRIVQIEGSQTTEYSDAMSTATAIISQVTANAAAGLDPFALTASAVVADITSTVQAQEAQSVENEFMLTGTAIIQNATATIASIRETFEASSTPLATATVTATGSATVTATPTGTPIPTMTAAGTMLPVTSVASFDALTATVVPAQPQAVFTSTASFVAMTPTPRELGELDDTGALPDSTVNAAPVTGSDSPDTTTIENNAPAGTQVAAASITLMPPTPTIIPDFSQLQLQPLKAGEIDDNADWDTYMLYRRNYLELYPGSVIDVDVSGRRIIEVVDTLGQPVLGALVEVYAGETLVANTITYATGQTLFFPKLREEFRFRDVFTVIVTKNGVRAEAELDLTKVGNTLRVILAVQQAGGRPRLDVTFLIDTTSSMDDEIRQLQNNILYIAGETAKLDADVRYGLVLYRDWGNEQYVLQVHDFVSDVTQYQLTLNTVEAWSGAFNQDWPEALNEGLYEAVNTLSWRGDDTVKLVFLVGDASPHLNHPNETHIYSEEMLTAAAKGIKIHSVASSGLEPEGEYIFRQISQVTMGHFIFLTYDTDSTAVTGAPPGANRPDLNVGEPEDEQGAGAYTVEQLHEIVLRLITDELAALPGGA